MIAGERLSRRGRFVPAGSVSTLLLFLLVAGIAATGTWASFTSATGNGSSIASGTLLLRETKGVTTCTSTESGNTDVNERDCGDHFTLFGLPVHRPGDTAFEDLTFSNPGTVDGTQFGVGAMGCTTSNGAGTYHGTADLCGILTIAVKRYASASDRTNDLNPTFTMPAQPLSTFVANQSGAAVFPLGALATSDTAYVKVVLSYPSTAANDTQGRAATFGLRWRLAQ